MRRLLTVSFGLLIFGALFFGGCSDDDESESPELSLTIQHPVEDEILFSTIVVEAETDPIANRVEFDFDTFATVIDSSEPFAISYDVSLYPDGEYTAYVTAYLGETVVTDDVTFTILTAEPVVVGSDTLSEERIMRDDSAKVIGINLSEMELSESDCLAGIEQYGSMLQYLEIQRNELDSIDLTPCESCPNLILLNVGLNKLIQIDLSPLSSCSNLEYLYLYDNQLTEVDISILWDLTALNHLYIYGNELDSTTCDQICNFISEHPDCYVEHDCDCGEL